MKTVTLSQNFELELPWVVSSLCSVERVCFHTLKEALSYIEKQFMNVCGDVSQKSKMDKVTKILWVKRSPSMWELYINDMHMALVNTNLSMTQCVAIYSPEMNHRVDQYTSLAEAQLCSQQLCIEYYERTEQ